MRQECRRKVTGAKRVTGAIRFVVNAGVLHQSLFVPVLTYSNDTMI